jgi:hypothetical protein
MTMPAQLKARKKIQQPQLPPQLAVTLPKLVATLLKLLPPLLATLARKLRPPLLPPLVTLPRKTVSNPPDTGLTLAKCRLSQRISYGKQSLTPLIFLWGAIFLIDRYIVVFEKTTFGCGLSYYPLPQYAEASLGTASGASRPNMAGLCNGVNPLFKTRHREFLTESGASLRSLAAQYGGAMQRGKPAV